MDARIQQYQRALERMSEGQFDVEIAPGRGDAIGQLGEALVSAKATIGDRLEFALAVCGVVERMSAGLGLEETCDQVYDALRPLLPYDRMGLALLSDDGTRVTARWARSNAPELHIQQGYEAPLENSSLETILDTAEPRVLNDLEAYARQHPGSDSTRRIVAEGMRSSLTCPLITDGEPVGFVFFSSADHGTYQRAHVETFQAIAAQLATAVEKSRLYEESLELNQFNNRLLGVVAHDVRGPMIEMSEYLRLLDAGAYGTLPMAAARVLRRLERRVQQMRERTDELLDASSIQAGELDLQLRTVGLDEYLEDRYRDLRLIAQSKSIDLWLDLQPGLPDVRIDPARIDQVLSSLVANAVGNSVPESAITVGAHMAGDLAEIFVSDQGRGIPDDELGTLLQGASAGVRTAVDERGTGIGLAIADRVVAAHGGTLRVSSPPGDGPTFAFTLPVTGSIVAADAAIDELHLVEL